MIEDAFSSQSVQYMATDFLPLTNAGTIDVTQVNTNWSIVQTLNLTAKPVSYRLRFVFY
jgi:hypothetical protein